jgi:photosystem II stability/assembly factor-like uncharacterized protein
MTHIIAFQLASLAFQWTAQDSGTTAGLRGLRVVSPQVVWASGTQGTYLTTMDGGEHWRAASVPGAEKLDFRDVEAFDDKTAYLLASGEGDKSRVYKTVDGGGHWKLLFTNPDPKGFFDGLAFWDANHAILVGDPVDGQFVIYTTADAGKTWQRQKTPAALDGEGAFAASGTSIVARGSKDAWFVTGGPEGGRVFRSRDGGRTWKAAKTPLGGTKTAGIFSISLFGKRDGVIVGGDYQNPKSTVKTLALTKDGGKSWEAVESKMSFRSCVTVFSDKLLLAVGIEGSDVSRDAGKTWQHFSDINLNAVAGTEGSVWAVGPKGVMMKLGQRK